MPSTTVQSTGGPYWLDSRHMTRSQAERLIAAVNTWPTAALSIPRRGQVDADQMAAFYADRFRQMLPDVPNCDAWASAGLTFARLQDRRTRRDVRDMVSAAGPTLAPMCWRAGIGRGEAARMREQQRLTRGAVTTLAALT